MAITKIPAAGFTGNNFRNIFINGDMSIAQRGTSQATAGSANGSYQTLDRYKFFNDSLGAFTWSQETDVPTGQGFANSMKFDCTTADASPAAGDYLFFSQFVEAQNCQYLKQGTANAKSLTLSFWVKSNKTGTYCSDIRNTSSSRLISKSYTIDASNTWEKKTITFDGDTVGTIPNNNGVGLQCTFWLGAGTNFTSGTLNTSWGATVNANRAVGQVNIADSTSNDFLITGVQLEAGTTASDFEFLPVDVNLARCQRYCLVVGDTPNGLDFSKVGNVGHYYDTTGFYPTIVYQYPMRATPSFTASSQSAGTVYSNGAGRAVTAITTNTVLPTTVNLYITTSSATAGHGGHLDFGSGVFATLSAEL